MKKITSLLITSAVLLCMTGCSAVSVVRVEENGGNQTVVTTAPVTTTAPITTAVETTTTTATTTTTSEPVETTTNKPDEQEYNKEAVNALIEKILENNKDITKPATTTTVDNSIWDEPATTTTVDNSIWDEPATTTTVDNSIWDEPATTTTVKKYTWDDIDEAAVIVNGNIDNIKKICGLKSDVEKDITICAVNVYDKHNPYDVVYNYGTNYNAFVKACDWSLVFDANYYIKQFPMLATQYHNDKALLLEHFQTVGIHEGRQGSAKFNVGAYKANCDSKLRSAFGTNYEGYYFYYMLNYETEKSVKTTGNYKNQYKQIMTACQAAELEGVNGYRDEVNVADIAFHSELAAFANYRAYLNAHDDYRIHEWFDNNPSFLIKNFKTVYNANAISENTCYYDNLCKHEGKTFYTYYKTSKPHYEAMISARYEYIGLSNVYYSCEDNFTNQFQTFLDV